MIYSFFVIIYKCFPKPQEKENRDSGSILNENRGNQGVNADENIIGGR